MDPTKGNLIDNLTFKIAYRLSYDANGGTKKQASRISSKTFGKAKTARTEAIASRASGDELAVNGGFDVPKWSIAKEGQGLPWIYVYADKGVVSSYYQYANGQNGTKMPGLTTSSFAWRDVDAIGGHQAMELHREKDGNTAADVHAGRTVAQTVATTPGAAYTFSIRHSGRSKGNAGGVTLLAGPDKDHLTPVKLTRTTVSKTGAKYGDKTGDVGTVAYTHSDSADATEGSHDPWDHSDDWESYEGTVIIPAGQSRTMIAYRGVAKDGKLTASANDSIIDDLSFRLAYKLSYDANGGTKKSTSQIGSKTDGTVKAIANTSDSLPAELVNGSFDYPAGLIAGASTKYPWGRLTVVDPINGRYARHIGVDKDLWLQSRDGTPPNSHGSQPRPREPTGSRSHRESNYRRTPRPATSTRNSSRDRRHRPLPGHRHHPGRVLPLGVETRQPRQDPPRRDERHDWRTRQGIRPRRDANHRQRQRRPAGRRRQGHLHEGAQQSRTGRQLEPFQP